MRLKLSSLLLLVAAFAIMFAIVRYANGTVVAILHFATIITACTGAVVAFHSTGRLQSFALAYSVFSFAMLFFRPVPNFVSVWVWENVRSDRPFKTVADVMHDMLNEMTADDLLQLSIGILVSLTAATLSASLCKTQ